MTEVIGQFIPSSPIPRTHFSHALGYMDAKHMVYLKETFGFPLEIYIDGYRQKFPKAKCDYAGLEHELLMIGTNPKSVESIISELKMIDKEWGMAE